MTELHDGSAVPERETGDDGRDGSVAARDRSDRGERRPSPVARTSLYFRQVVAEMRKVIWPTRTELTHYTIVVLVFVLVMIALISVLDYGFGRLMFWVFG
ncbi:preprotein translocase subunit SecE [Motilibacter aurantiacus]|uniref:preprotein translocase subunit SecE n=1 Tax=Motilibacter aurantiacus TaxID=2714955 RepID=UPI002F2B7DAB